MFLLIKKAEKKMRGKRQERKDMPWERGTYVKTYNTDCPNI